MRRDLVIIGGGPAGTAAALVARPAGQDVVLVEQPRQSLRGVAERALAEDLQVRPLAAAPPERREDGFQRAVRRVGEVASAIRDERDRRLARAGVARLVGRATLPGDAGVVEVALGRGLVERVVGRVVLVATGGRRSRLASSADQQVMAAEREALLDDPVPPASVIIVGGGAEGVQLAGLFACAGTDVVLIEAASSILPTADADVSAAVRRALEGAGCRVVTDVRIATIVRTAAGTWCARAAGRVEPAGESAGEPAGESAGEPAGESAGESTQCLAAPQWQAQRVLVAAGHEAAIAGLATGAVAAALAAGPQPGSCLTSLPWLAVAGNAAGWTTSAEGALREGRAAAAELLGTPRPAPRDALPVFVAGVGGCGWSGLTEAEAVTRGHSVHVGRAKLPGRGLVAPGFVKVIVDRSSQRVLGVHVAGGLGREAVALGSVLVERGLSRADVAEFGLPVGSPAEAVVEAAAGATAP